MSAISLSSPQCKIEPNHLIPLVNNILLPFAELSRSTMEKRSCEMKAQAIISVQLETIISTLKTLQIENSDMEALKSEDQNLSATFLVDKLFNMVLSQNAAGLEKIDKNLLISLRNSQGLPLFSAAVCTKDVQTVKKMMSQINDLKFIQAKDPYGRSAMHFAAMHGRHDLITILSQQLSLAEPDQGGFTPLHWAIQAGDVKTIEVFADKGISLGGKWKYPGTNQSYSPLALAVMMGHQEVITSLIQHDDLKKIDLTESIGEIGNILHLAITCNQASILAHLLQNYSKQIETLLNQRDQQDRTPLQLAAFLGDLGAIRFLYNQAIQLNVQDQSGATAVHYAVKGQQPEAIQLLDFLGANLKEIDDKGKTPLGYLVDRTDLTPQEEACKAKLINLSLGNQHAKFAPIVSMRRPPLNLVFQGGGPKGLAYLGVLQALESKELLENLRMKGLKHVEEPTSVFNQQPDNLLSEVRRIAGTSAGAITAALLAIGYDTVTIETHLKKDFIELLDFKDDLQKDLFDVAKDPTKTKAVKAILKDYWRKAGVIHFVGAGMQLFKQLTQTYALCHGKKFLDWIEPIIKEGTGYPLCTFGQLADLVKSQPTKYKHLHIFAINLKPDNTQEIARFSSEDDKWKNLIISHAIRASVSIPGVFEPHYLYFKNPDEPGHKGNKDSYYGQFVDGGLVQNLPIEAFDEKKYQEESLAKGIETNPRTLGFSLKEVSSIPEPETPSTEIKSLKTLVVALKNIYSNAEPLIRNVQNTAQGRVIVIEVKDVTLFDFALTEGQKIAMIQEGEKAVKTFLGFQQEIPESASTKQIQVPSPSVIETTHKEVDLLPALKEEFETKNQKKSFWKKCFS